MKRRRFNLWRGAVRVWAAGALVSGLIVANAAWQEYQSARQGVRSSVGNYITIAQQRPANAGSDETVYFYDGTYYYMPASMNHAEVSDAVAEREWQDEAGAARADAATLLIGWAVTFAVLFGLHPAPLDQARL